VFAETLPINGSTGDNALVPSNGKKLKTQVTVNKQEIFCFRLQMAKNG
jgi:hypothetical protein